MQNLKDRVAVKNKSEFFLTGFFILMSIMACSFTGIFIPAFLKDREIRNTNYYEVINVSINKEEYRPGEGIVVTIQRNALQDLELNSIRELNLIKIDGDLEEIYTQTTQGIAEKGSFRISSIWLLPEHKIDGTPLEAGTYYWQSDISYKVDNIFKTEMVKTPTFKILPE
jgi:hypothetical protein